MAALFPYRQARSWALISFVALTAGILSSCGPSVRIFSDVDDTGRFELYTTYNFLGFSEGNQKTIPDMS